MPPIYLESIHPTFQKIKSKSKISHWVQSVIDTHAKKCGQIQIVFCDDNSLEKLNADFLNHKTLTDIITFNYNAGERLEGEIYISIDRVNENAQKYNATFENELMRVIIHGILHLAGFNDKTSLEKAIMREEENKALLSSPNLRFM